jgi:hypothetical protein
MPADLNSPWSTMSPSMAVPGDLYHLPFGRETADRIAWKPVKYS